MAVNLRVIRDREELRRVFESPSGALARDLRKRGGRVQAQARKNLGGGTGSGPKRVASGLLRNTIYSELVSVNGGLRQRIGSRVYYAYWVHEGTGIYGPRAMKIVPKTAKTLAWKSKKYGAKRGKYKGWVFAASVKGMKPNRFLTKALPAATLIRGAY